VTLSFLRRKLREYEEIKRQIQELSREIEGKETEDIFSEGPGKLKERRRRIFFQRKCWRPWTEYPEEFRGCVFFTKKPMIKIGYTIYSPVTEGAEPYPRSWWLIRLRRRRIVFSVSSGN